MQKDSIDVLEKQIDDLLTQTKSEVYSIYKGMHENLPNQPPSEPEGEQQPPSEPEAELLPPSEPGEEQPPSEQGSDYEDAGNGYNTEDVQNTTPDWEWFEERLSVTLRDLIGIPTTTPKP